MTDGNAVVHVYKTASEEETRDFARRLGCLLGHGDTVLLVGELGAGKTRLAQGIARGLGVAEWVTSPTFTLLREYSGRIPLYHLDAYRLEGPWDLYDLGMEEYMEGEGVLVVEWGDRVRSFFGPQALEMEIAFGEGENERVIRVYIRGGDWEGRLARLSTGGESLEREG